MSLKVVSGVFAVSGIGGIGYSVYEGLRNKEISEILKESGLLMLDVDGRSNDEQWKEILEDYSSNNDNSEGKGFLKRTISSEDKDKETTIKELQAKCKEVFSKRFSINDQENYLNAQRWCVKKEKISDSFGTGLEKTGESTKDAIIWAVAFSRFLFDKQKWPSLIGPINSTDDLKTTCKSYYDLTTTKDKGFIEKRNFTLRHCVKFKNR